MVTAMPGGRRRIDRVLAPEFLSDVTELPMPALRERRQDAMQEEADLSYIRRMLQGRIEILTEELRDGGELSDEDLVARLTSAMVSRGRPESSSRHLVAEPSRLAERRRYVERLIAEHSLSVRAFYMGGGTPTFLSDEELAQLMGLVRGAFRILPQCEVSIEVDPRSIALETIPRLARIGMNRMSIGVQDFDPDVQKAVHRIQPVDMTMAVARLVGTRYQWSLDEQGEVIYELQGVLYDLESGQYGTLEIPEGMSFHGGAWSPDGSRIVGGLSDEEAAYLWQWDPQGVSLGELYRIDNPEGHMLSIVRPVWSPGGTWLAVELQRW